MFEKKPVAENLAALKVEVNTIPTDFYAGANPVIKFKSVEKEVDLQKEKKITLQDKALLNKQTVAGGDKKIHPANLFSNRRFLLIGVGILFVVFCVFGGLYYWWQIKKTQPTTTPKPPALSETAPVVTPEITPAVTITEEVTTTAPTVFSPTESKIEFPSRLLGTSVDTDKDDITDVGEELFKTDPTKVDTDGDGYSDGHEVFNLYNPIGKEPMKLLDSGLVKEFTNPSFGYKLYYPVSWAMGNVDPDYRDVLFSTLTGENIEVRVFDLQPNQTFADWFTVWSSGENFADLTDFSTVFKTVGKKRSDDLVYYFVSGQHVFALVYHTTDSQVVNYKIVLKMIARSFRSNSENIVMPEQKIENSGLETTTPAISTTTTAPTL